MRSYEDLASLGYVRITTRSGTFVSDRPPSENHGHQRVVETTSVDPAVFSQFTLRLLEIQATASSSSDLPNINYGATPASLLPIKIWRQILAQHCAPDAAEKFAYTAEDLGYRPLRDEMSRYLNHTRGLHCDGDQVVVFSNSQLPLALISRMLIDEGDLVAVEDPCHSGAKEFFLSCGARLAYIPIDADGMMVSELAKLNERCKLVYTTPAHQDPTGVEMSLARRKALLAWAAKGCDYIVEDGFDSDYFYKPPRLPALAGLDTNDKVLHIYSLWKLLFPLVTTSTLVLPHSLIPAFSRVKASVDREFSILEHQALADLLGGGHLKKYVHKTRAIYQQRRQAMIFALRQVFKRDIEFFGDGGGLHVTIRTNWSLTPEEILSCAKASGLPMVSTSGYYAAYPVPGEYLISFALVNEQEAMPIVERFAAEMAKLLGR
jgi:GntR family transcriptional regulator/MocR family aminotransferase